MQHEGEGGQTMIRKAQGEDEKKIVQEVKTDNEKRFPYIRNVRSGRTVAVPPSKTEQKQFIDRHGF